MASKVATSNPYFFIFDFYMMSGSNDSNDILPKAITYFYPTGDQIKEEKILQWGEIVGIVQYFQHDLFRSIPRTLYFQNSIVAHKHFGRHSGFLCVPDDRYTAEEAQVYLKHILTFFNTMYGTWNHIQSTYEQDDKIYDFLNQALTPIVKYVLNQHRSISILFSSIEYAPLKSGNQRVLLESKHYLGYLKSKYGLHDGFIEHDDKILYSTCDPDTTFYLQLLYHIQNESPENLITTPWESEFRLRNGVSLFRIYIRQPSIPKPTKKFPTTTTTTGLPSSKVSTKPINIREDLPSGSDNSPPSSQNLLHRFSASPSSITDTKHSAMIFFKDPSDSSEEAGFETDTREEFSTPSNTDVMSTSSISLGGNLSDRKTEDSDSSSSPNFNEKSLTDEQKLEKSQSRSLTISSERDIEKTLEFERRNSIHDSNERKNSLHDSNERKNSLHDSNERKNNLHEPIERIHFKQVDTSDDEATFQINNQILSDSPRDRTRTMTTISDLNTKEFFKSDRHEGQVTWDNIPDKNTEHERDQLVLYVQKHSRMVFVGIIEKSLLTNDYLNKLWALMLPKMANMETEIQVISTSTDIIRFTTDVKFHFNENTRSAEFERIFDGVRYYRRIPSEESTYMAYFAQTELNRHVERKVIGLSQGSHLVSIDRRLPDRITYSCRRYEETL